MIDLPTVFNGKANIRLATFLRLNDPKFQRERRKGPATATDDVGQNQRSGTTRRRRFVDHVLSPTLPAVSSIFLILWKVQSTAGTAQKVHFFWLGVHFKRSAILHLFPITMLVSVYKGLEIIITFLRYSRGFLAEI